MPSAVVRGRPRGGRPARLVPLAWGRESGPDLDLPSPTHPLAFLWGPPDLTDSRPALSPASRCWERICGVASPGTPGGSRADRTHSRALVLGRPVRLAQAVHTPPGGCRPMSPLTLPHGGAGSLACGDCGRRGVLVGEGGHEEPRARRTASPRTAPPPDGPQTTGGRAPAPAPHLPTLLPASWRPAHSGLPGEAQSERRRQRGRGRGRGSVGTAATVRLSPAGARGLSGDRASLVLPLPATRGPREADARRAAPRPAGRPPRPQQEGRLRTNRGRTAGHASARGRGPRALSPKSKIVGPGSTRTCTEAPLPATGARVGDPRAPRPAARAEARVARLRVHLGEDIAGGSTP